MISGSPVGIRRPAHVITVLRSVLHAVEQYYSVLIIGTAAGLLMALGSAGSGAVRDLVDEAWSAGAGRPDPDDPRVRGFAEFGLRQDSGLATDGGLRALHAWRGGLHIPSH